MGQITLLLAEAAFDAFYESPKDSKLPSSILIVWRVLLQGTIDYIQEFQYASLFFKRREPSLMNEALLQMKHNLGTISHSAVCNTLPLCFCSPFLFPSLGFTRFQIISPWSTEVTLLFEVREVK